MKKTALLYISLLILFGFSNCKKNTFFDLKRPPESPWTTVQEFERAPIGVYSRIFAGDSWNVAYINYSLVNVSEGDDVDWVNASEYGYKRNDGSINRYADRLWMAAYQAIAGSNVALDFVNAQGGNPFPDASAEDRTKNINRIIGELHFMRGFSYYLLMTIYGQAYVPGTDNSTVDIPLITSFATSLEQARTPKRGTTKELFDFMVEEFKKAKELLPERYSAGMHPSYQVGRANRFAAAAMLARTYFLMGDYIKAKNECDYIIDQNGGDFNLSEDPIEAFNKSSEARGKEVIFYAAYFDPQGVTPNHLTALNHIAGDWGECTWVETRMANTVIKRLGWMDNPQNDTTIKLTARRDKRFTQLMHVRYPATSTPNPDHSYDARLDIKNMTTIWNNKYFRGTGNSKFNTNLPIIRLAEIYLTRATCRFKTNDMQGAAEDLNIVRKRAWNEVVGGPFVPITSASITQQIIDDERLIEMFNEPDRINYLRGLKGDILPGDRPVPVEPYTSDKFIWVIPPRETLYTG
jgi:hypothetical protein